MAASKYPVGWPVVNFVEFDQLTARKGWETDYRRARELGIDESVLSRLRRGERRPSAVFIHRVMTRLGARAYSRIFVSEDVAA